MSDFQVFSRLVHARYEELAQHELFVVETDKDRLWNLYLNSFPEGTNPVFRERTEHDCACCRNFIKNLGGLVAVIDGRKVSVWSVQGLPFPYNVVAESMAAVVESLPISELFRTKELRYGLEKNHETLANGTVLTWNHFHGQIDGKHLTSNPAEFKGSYATNVAVFQRGLDEIKPEAVHQVLELIDSNSLYRGEEHRATVASFFSLHAAYLALGTDTRQQNQFVWTRVTEKGARIRNTVIGSLLQDLSEGVDLERAVASFEAKVAPANYKRTTALITPRMIEDAMKTIRALDLEPALERRLAKFSDLSVNNVLWVDNSVKGQMKDGVAGLLMEATRKEPVDLTRLTSTSISIETFMADVLPNAQTLRVYVKNAHQANLMSLTAPVHADVQPLFKWANNFGWSYNGNITDSIKEKVKRAGGNTGAPLRVSLAWFNGDDLDIHAHCPNGHVYFGNKMGILDVDMNAGWNTNSTDPVENLSWDRPVNGQYTIAVNQFNARSADNPGFVLEVENAGQVSQYSYNQKVQGTIECLTFTVKHGLITDLRVNSSLTGQGIKQDKWGIQTEQFVKVDTVLFSPNHWDDQAVGNKHWFFILEGCKNDEPARGIYNEFLKSDLDKHRKVFEVLGEKTKCPVSDEQLSGLGFSSTRKEELLVLVGQGRSQTAYTIQF